MSSVVGQGQKIRDRVLRQLVSRIAGTAAIEEPFSHLYVEEVLPPDLYEEILRSFPDPAVYTGSAERYRGGGGDEYVRRMLPLTPAELIKLPAATHELWRGIAAALTAPELKEAVFAKLARDLAYRYGVPEKETTRLPGYSRPTLYRETDGFEIPPHPDTRKKVVTMHLYLPADRSQLGLGTALYRRKLLAWPFGDWRSRFEKVKQFSFQPNSAYAFVVNNTLVHKSWHGRERLPAGAGVRNTLLNTFYECYREEFSNYLPGQALAA
jgi:hypothetical protein